MEDFNEETNESCGDSVRFRLIADLRNRVAEFRTGARSERHVKSGCANFSRGSFLSGSEGAAGDVSVIKDGAVVKQREIQFNSNVAFPLPAGLYDVRIEGDGMQTLVKRGIHVNEGERTNM